MASLFTEIGKANKRIDTLNRDIRQLKKRFENVVGGPSFGPGQAENRNFGGDVYVRGTVTAYDFILSGEGLGIAGTGILLKGDAEMRHEKTTATGAIVKSNGYINPALIEGGVNQDWASIDGKPVTGNHDEWEAETNFDQRYVKYNNGAVSFDGNVVVNGTVTAHDFILSSSSVGIAGYGILLKSGSVLAHADRGEIIHSDGYVNPNIFENGFPWANLNLPASSAEEWAGIFGFDSRYLVNNGSGNINLSGSIVVSGTVTASDFILNGQGASLDLGGVVIKDNKTLSHLAHGGAIIKANGLIDPQYIEGAGPGGGGASNFSDLNGTLSDTQHGARGGGSLHAVATNLANGFMSKEDKAELDSLVSGGGSADWADISSKPSTATRWPDWDEVSGKPSSFNPASHNHSAGDITSGTFSSSRIPNLTASKITSGTFSTSRIPNLDADKIDSGVFNKDRIPSNMSGKTLTVDDIILT